MNCCSPCFRRNVGYVLRERPPMATAIFNSILTLSKWHIVRGLHDTCAALLRMLEVPSNVLHRDANIRADLLRLWRAKRTPLSTNHDRAVAEQKLGVADHPVPSKPQPLGETEYATKPLDRPGDILVDEDRNNGGIRCRAICHGLTRPR